MKIAFGQGPYGVELTINELTLSEFSEFCSEAQQGPKHDAWFLRGGDVKKVESHKTSGGTEYGPGYYRGNRYLKSAEFIIIDGDASIDNPKSAPSPILAHEALKELNIKHFIYTTHSHSKTVNKFRAVIPCRMTPNQLEATAIKIIQDLNEIGLKVKYVNEMKVWAQLWYLPTRDDPDDGIFEYYEYLEGNNYLAVESLDAPEQEKGTGASASTGGLTYEEHIAAMFKTGEGHIHYAPAAQSLANTGQNAEQIFKTLQPVCVAAFNIHNREWNEGRDTNLMEAAESAVLKVEGERKIPVIEAYENADDSSIASTIKRLPQSVLAPADLYGELVIAADATMHTPNMMSANLAADGIIAYLAGGKYAGTLRGDRVNFYGFISGGSGIGKDVVVSFAPKVIDALSFDDNELRNSFKYGVVRSFASPQAIDEKFAKLGTRPDILFSWDEFGIGLIEASKGNNTKYSGTLDVLLELWSTSDTCRQKREKVSDKHTIKDMPTFYAPNLIVIGGGTEASIIDGLSSSFILHGNIARIMMYPGSIYARAPRRDNEVADELSLSSELVGNLNKLATPIKPSSIHTSELARLYMPNRVTFEDDAGDYVYEIKKYVSSLPDDSLKKNIQNRRAMNIKKKAMFRALVNCPDNPVVTLDTIKWADMFVEYSCNYQYKMFADAVGETATDTALKRVVAKLKEANGRPVSIRDLKQLPSMRKLKAPRQKDEIIKEVCECWGYEIIEATTGGRGKKSFYLAPNDD